MADAVLKIGAIFVSSAIAGFSLYFSIIKDRFPHPLRISGAVLSLLTLLVCVFMGLAGVHYGYSIGDIGLNLIIFGLLFWFTKERDIGGVNVGQQIVEYITRGDYEICYILHLLKMKGQIRVTRNVILRALSSTIWALVNLLRLDIQHDSQVSIFRATGGGFKVIAEHGLQSKQISTIEREFRYEPQPYGLAGHALHEKETISIPDLLDPEDPSMENWRPTYHDEKRGGSIICIPVLSGLEGDDHSQPMGVLNLTSLRKNAFDSASKRSLLNKYANRIEILLSCLQLVEQKATP